MHSNSHLGISMAAMARLGAAIPHLDYALDTHYPWQVDEEIKGGKIKIEDGFVTVTKSPGLEMNWIANNCKSYTNCFWPVA